LVHGRKTIEVRRWPTARRGRILIHAAKVADARPYAWSLVPDELRAAAELCGGIIGSAELRDCKVYRNREMFLSDQVGHLNDPSWFQEPALYGFVFAQCTQVDFYPYPGWVRFFRVEELPPEHAAQASDT
jgi:hypothetical protein